MSLFHFCLSAAKNLSSFQLLPASLITDLLQLEPKLYSTLSYINIKFDGCVLPLSAEIFSYHRRIYAQKRKVTEVQTYMFFTH